MVCSYRCLQNQVKAKNKNTNMTYNVVTSVCDMNVEWPLSPENLFSRILWPNCCILMAESYVHLKVHAVHYSMVFNIRKPFSMTYVLSKIHVNFLE